MRSQRLLSWTWVLFLLGACAVLVWNTSAQIRRLEYLSAIGATGETRPASVADSIRGDPELSPCNSLPIADEFPGSYHWLAQTERMLNRGEVRVRHIDYENAPSGRTVLAPSPYRWWLAFVAWCEHLAGGARPSTVVEKAALWADPVLLGLVMVGMASLAARYFGPFSASLLSVGLISLFPFVTGFLPGVPDDRGLAEALAIASVLFPSIGAAEAAEKGKATRRWFILAGIAGGLGLWVKVSVELPVLLGIAGGGLLGARLVRSAKSPESEPVPGLPWRAWAIAGAATTCIASLIEYSPSELRAWELSFVHPLHGLAWLGAGELLVQASAWVQRRPSRRSAGNIVVVLFSVAAVVAVPAVLVLRNGTGVFAPDAMDTHLTRLHDGIVAQNLAAWVGTKGPSVWLFLTWVPVCLLLPALWALGTSAFSGRGWSAVAIALGPALVALAVACFKLVWWQTFDGLALISLAAVAPMVSSRAIAPRVRLVWTSIVLALLVPGVVYALGWARQRPDDALSRTELHALILRDLAGWISQRSDPASVVVLAPPRASTALCYFGDFRGLGSASDENTDGIGAAIRIMTAQNPEEAKEMVNRRKITHIVLLSWDPFFSDLARAANGQVGGTLVDRLKFATLPRWLRPLAYTSPSIPGFEDNSVTVFEVVDEQDDATTLGNIALYLVETGDLNQAQRAAEGLTRYSTDFGAWVARAQVAAAVHDDVEMAKDLKVIQERLALRVQPSVSWSRRVDLAVVLARANLTELARKQLMVCLKTVDDDRMRSLSPLSAYRLMIMCRGLGVTMPAAQHDLAVRLMPPALRDRFQ